MLLCQLIFIVVLASAAAQDEATGDAAETDGAKASGKDVAIAGTVNLGRLGSLQLGRGGGKKKSCCADGWMSWADSCYKFIRSRQIYQQARLYCEQSEAELFVPDTVGEWDVVTDHATMAMWTWIGLAFRPFARGATGPMYETFGGLMTETLPWLNKATGHGHTAGSDCVAYFRAADLNGAYIHFYPCNHRNYIICERNLTLIHQQRVAAKTRQ